MAGAVMLSRAELVCDSVWLAVTTIVFLAVCVVNGFASSPVIVAGGFGFINTTEDISDQFYTQVTPAGYAFTIWGVIYAWQVLWIAYAWSFICRPKSQRAVFISVHVGYNIVNSLNIAWLYAWGNAYVKTAAGIIVLLNVSLYSTIGMFLGYFHNVKGLMSKCDIWCTRLFVMNGLCFYSAWVTMTICTNLTSALQYTTSLSGRDAAVIGLSILLVMLLTFFVLENTILDRYGFRYVFSVYPVLLWTFIAMLVEHWMEEGAERTVSYVIVLLILLVILIFLRILLVVLFTVRKRLHV